MGSEQSSQQGSFRSHPNQAQNPLFKRQQTIGVPSDVPLDVRSGSSSPGPSICSDNDVPYVSYTLNAPIGGNTYLNIL